MQASTRNAWVILPLAFSMFLYAGYVVSQFDDDATIVQWCSGIGAVLIAVLALFQSVKGLMHDMTWDEKFPEEFDEFDE